MYDLAYLYCNGVFVINICLVLLIKKHIYLMSFSINCHMVSI